MWSASRVLGILLSAGVLSAGPNLRRLPLTFEPAPAGSGFIAHAGGVALEITAGGAVVGPAKMRLVGARRSALAHAEGLEIGYSNYLLDKDPRRWRTRVPNYRRIRYRNVYPGIDVVYYGSARGLEFDFIVAPGADPRRIQLALSSPDLKVQLPRVYQGDHTVAARPVRRGNRASFELAAYDRKQPLVIDPVLSYAAVFGGGGPDEGLAIAADSSGSAYVVGSAQDGNFPLANGQPGRYSFLAKLSPAGDALLYSTYLPWSAGGGSKYAVDAAGNAFLARDGVPGAPVIGPPPLTDCRTGPPDVYAAKLSSDGTSLIYSGCLGGRNAEFPTAIAVDSAGSAYITGLTLSPDFPLLNPVQSTYPDRPGASVGFVLKLNPDGALVYSTFLGGGSGDMPHAIAADTAGNAYITGQASSANFPLKNAVQTQLKAHAPAAFVSKISADGSELVYSTYLGGSNGNSGLAVAADAQGNTYVAGSTASGDFPTTSAALQPRFNGVFLFKTIDAAATWQRSDSGLPGGASFVQVDANGTIYAVSSGVLFKSTDHGASWAATAAALPSRVWVSPVDSTLYVSTTRQQLLRSRDGGATFTVVPALAGNINQVVFDPTNASVVYVRLGGNVGGDGVYKTSDGGDTWKPTGLSGPRTGSGGFAIDPAHPSTLYASSNAAGLQRSDDGGDTWTAVDASTIAYQLLVDSASTLYVVSNGAIFVKSGDALVKKTAPQNVGALVIDPANTSTWYAITYSSSGARLYKTSDAGDTWQPVDAGLPNPPPIASLALDPSSPGTLYLGMGALTDGFFAKLTSDGSALAYSSYLGGSGADAVNAIAVDELGDAYLAGVTNSGDFPMQAAFQTGRGGFVAKFDRNNTLLWSSPLGGVTPAALALGPAGELYLTGGASTEATPTPGAVRQDGMPGDFFRTSDSSISWTGATLAPSLNAVTAVALDPKTPSRIYAVADRLYASDDGGQTWSALGGLGSPITRLIVDPRDSANIYAAGFGGLWKSSDRGVTWSSIRLIPTVPFGPISALAIDPQTPSTLYAAALYPVSILPPGSPASVIFKTTDGGATWNPTGSPPYATAIAVDPRNPAILYASVSGGAGPDYLSTSSDGGATWTTTSTALPLASFLMVDPATPGRIYALGLSPHFGIYRSDDAGSSWNAIGTGLPAWQVNALAIDPANAANLYAGSAAGGLYRSTDAGMNWTIVPGLGVPIVNAIAIDPADSTRVYAGTQANSQDVFVMKIIP